jgi:nicotinate-nucleotide adenylyltransferase
MIRRILYGGSFDPVHAGHLHVAAHALRALGADRLAFVPAFRSPHKTNGTSASAEDRLAMLRLAAQEDPRFDVLDTELRRGGPSYTVDTVRELLAPGGPFAGDALVLLIGQDALCEFHRWQEARALAALAPIAWVPRPGAPEPPWEVLADAIGADAAAAIRTRRLPVPPHRASSTEVRTRAASGRTVRCWVTDPVADYIEAKGLYGARPAAR